jgi:hypothetical protein
MRLPSGMEAKVMPSRIEVEAMRPTSCIEATAVIKKSSHGAALGAYRGHEKVFR